MNGARMWMVVLVATIAGVQPGAGQTDAKSLEAALKHNLLALRSYSADSVARYDWTNGSLQVKRPSVFTVGIFDTDSVKVKKDVVQISGKRETVLWDAKNKRPVRTAPAKMTLEVRLNGAAPDGPLQQLEGLLFFPDLRSAVAGLPDPAADRFPFDMDGKPVIAPNSKTAKLRIDGKWIRPEPEQVKVQPKLISSQEPEFTSDARAAKISGTVNLGFTVTENGAVEDIWAGRPLGYGLDEAAIKALRGYKFTPGLLDGKAVAIPLVVEVNFQIFD